MKLHKDPSCGSYVTACSQKDGWTCLLRLIIAIQSVNVPSIFFLCFVDRASRYICVLKTILIHYLSSVYFVNQPLHVSGIFVAHYEEVYCRYTTIGTCCIYIVYLLMMGYKYAQNM
jgi:hypothetical protein